MVAATVDAPFTTDDVEDVILAETPLVNVLFQVRFPHAVTRVQEALDSKEFHRRLADDYPYAEEQAGMQVLIVPGQAPSVQPGPKAWAWRSASQSRTASITQEAISLTVEDYSTRADFVDAARQLLFLAGEVARIPQSSRIGVRYLNRVVDDGSLHEWIPTLAKGARGILATVDSNDSGVLHSFSQAIYQYPDQRRLQAKWGLISAGEVVDPTMGAVPARSWVLDIDCFEEQTRSYDADAIAQTIEELASRAYRFFRWVVTPESLNRFGPQGAS